MKAKAVAPSPESPPDADPTPAPSFEDQLRQLEGLVDTLERGDLSLEASLAAFERGVLLTRTCQQALDAAEQRVRILTSSTEGAEPEPFTQRD
jgi:exodeoxyribonuclease VII small subunit